jgi:hypothetical protein
MIVRIEKREECWPIDRETHVEERQNICRHEERIKLGSSSIHSFAKERHVNVNEKNSNFFFFSPLGKRQEMYFCKRTHTLTTSIKNKKERNKRSYYELHAVLFLSLS